MTSPALAYICCHVLCAGVSPGACSRDTLLSRSDRALERMIELNAQDDVNAASLLETLTALHEHPLDINRATGEELQQIPGIDPLLALAIVAARDKRPIRNMDELKEVEGMTSEILERIKPFITVRRSLKTPRQDVTNVSFRSRVVSDNVQGRSAASLGYPGSLMKLQTRLVARFVLGASADASGISQRTDEHTTLTLGLATEKEPGEKDYFDCVAGHVGLTIPSLSTRVVIGNFSVESAGGLMFGGGTGLSKGSDVIANAVASGASVRPSLSMDQSRNLRGIAVGLSGGPVGVSLFYSSKRLDAATDTAGQITRFDTDGLHRTNTELGQRNRVRESLIGSRLAYDPFSGVKLGISVSRTTWDVPIRLPGPCGFQGSGMDGITTDFSVTWSNASLYSEIMKGYKGLIGGVGGLLLRPGPTAKVGVLMRMYPAGLFSRYGSAFSETSSGSENEKGVYTAITFRPALWLRVSAFFDQFSFPWRRGNNQFASGGSELYVAVEGKPSKALSAEVAFRQKTRPTTSVSPQSNGFSQQTDCSRDQKNLRFVLDYGQSESFRWRSRVEKVWVQTAATGAREEGMLIYQDFAFVPLRGLSMNLRFIAFDTQSYESRLYEFESEVPGTYLSPGLSGKGFRWYVAVQCSLSEWLDLSVKCSQTCRESIPRILMEPEVPSYDYDNRLVAQVNVRF